MKNKRIKGMKRWISVLLAMSVLMLCIPSRAAGKTPRVVRVAFPQVKGLTETAEDGTRYGMVVDYLNEIAKYTGWEYEYIDTESQTMVDDFLDGKFELMGGTYYAEGFEAFFAYPDYNTGYSKSILLARQEDRSIRTNNLESLNGKTIGVYENAKENIRRLKEFLAFNGFHCTLKYYSSESFTDGNLYARLENGEVDLLQGNSTEGGDQFRVAAAYDSQPFYLVTNIGNQEVLDGLNMALEKITDANPSFGAERYAAHYPDRMSASVQLTEGELAYIKEKGHVTVAVLKNWHPLFCADETDDSHNGLVPDLLREVSAYSGLEFSYIYANTYMQAIQMVKRGDVDMLGFFLGTEADAADMGLALTAPYVNMNNIIIRNKASSYPGENLVCAIVEGQRLPGDIHAAKVVAYPGVREALSAVNRGEADIIYGLSARMERDIQTYQFVNLVPVTIVNDSDDLNFALMRPADPDLLTILNKALGSLSTDQKTELLNRNMVSMGAGNLSIIDIMNANPLLVILILSLFLAAVMTAVLLVNRSHTKAVIMENNLEKAEAESRAKGDFLSRMSHEIRTPMNAVMGLTDLTLMKNNMPEDVRENLIKIQSSSRYLRDLINDILDMNRLDSGMLSIAREPFSLGQLLDELQGMMENEAKRRGLSYTLEQDITHNDLTGDVIRLRQVLTNLLSNAFKFTEPGGSVCLRVIEKGSSDAGAEYSFRVSDTGVGVSEEDQKRIFSSFEQVGTNYSRSQGTGLGLAISSSIVELMDGRLKVKSKPGCGSEFYFTITLPYGAPVAAAKESRESLAKSGLLRGIRVLLAEDNDLNAEIIMQLLETQEAEVIRCENGRLAAEQFENSEVNAIRVILMDIQMPEMNGYEATRAIRGMDRPDAKTIPIIAMTANAFAEDVRAAADAGMNAHLSKPLDVEKMWSTLRGVLEGGAQE